MENRKTAIATVFALYGLVALVTTLAAPLATVWKAQPEIAGSKALTMLGNLMNYLGVRGLHPLAIACRHYYCTYIHKDMSSFN